MEEFLMRRSFWVLFAIFIMLWGISHKSMAKTINENAGTKSGQILKMSVGANAVGMGESYVASADDVYATYWNSAGLSKVEKIQIGLMHNEWFEDIRYEYIGYVQPLSNLGTIAGSVSYVSMGDLNRTDETGIEKGTFRPYDILAGLSYGTKLSNSLSLGISTKFLQETIDEQKAQAFAVDFGGMYSMKNGFIIGANVQNIGTKMKFVSESFGLPLNFNVGAAYKLLDNALTFAADANIPTDNDVNVGFGADYRIMGVFDLRFGYRYTAGGNDLGTASGLRAGIGFGIGSYKLDYAFVPYGELGQSHRISLLASF
jgi:hypothetical protein